MWTIPPEFVRVALTFSPCWGYPRCFNYGYSFFRKANVFCEESAKWRTSKSIFLHMGCNICGCWGRCSRYILKVSRVGASVNIPWLFKPEWYNQDTIWIISLNFFSRLLEWLKTLGRHRISGSCSQWSVNGYQILQELAYKNSKYEIDGLHSLQINLLVFS